MWALWEVLQFHRMVREVIAEKVASSGDEGGSHV